MSQNLLSATVVIGTLRVKHNILIITFLFSYQLAITFKPHSKNVNEIVVCLSLFASLID